MFKKVLLFILLFSFSFWINNFGLNICNAGINSAGFTIDTSDFSPWWTKLLDKVRAWWWNTTKSANIILWIIIKNLIIVFWVFSVLMMTIGWGMMIFHSWQESILTRWKWLFVWWVASLVIWLSSGLIVKMVSYFLY